MEKNKKMMMVIIILLVVLLAAVAGISVYGYTILRNGPAKETPPEVIVRSEATVENTETLSFSTPLNVNLKNNGTSAEYAISINVTVDIDASDAKDAELIGKIKQSEPAIRDIVITVLRDKTFDEVEGPGATGILKQEILSRIQEKFKTNLIYAVSFGDYFVVQVPN